MATFSMWFDGVCSISRCLSFPKSNTIIIINPRRCSSKNNCEMGVKVCPCRAEISGCPLCVIYST